MLLNCFEPRSSRYLDVGGLRVFLIKCLTTKGVLSPSIINAVSKIASVLYSCVELHLLKI